MELNDTIFPQPPFNYETLNNFQGDILYIPIDRDEYLKANNKPSSNSKEESEYRFIPCLILPAKRGKPTNNFIIMFHGNGEDIFYSYVMADALRQKLEMNVIVVEYPGYSLYEGEKSSATIQSDALYVYEFLKKEFKNVREDNIFVFGRSIGSAPAIYLASQKKVAALFLVSAFTSVKALAKIMVGFFSFLVKERFTSIEYIKEVTCPICFIHGRSDPLIPYTETEKLMESCSFKEKNEVTFPAKMTHNDFDMKEDILKPIKRFIAKNNLEKPSEGTVFPMTLFVMPVSVRTELKKSRRSPESLEKNSYSDETKEK